MDWESDRNENEGSNMLTGFNASHSWCGGNVILLAWSRLQEQTVIEHGDASRQLPSPSPRAFPETELECAFLSCRDSTRGGGHRCSWEGKA